MVQASVQVATAGNQSGPQDTHQFDDDEPAFGPSVGKRNCSFAAPVATSGEFTLADKAQAYQQGRIAFHPDYYWTSVRPPEWPGPLLREWDRGRGDALDQYREAGNKYQPSMDHPDCPPEFRHDADHSRFSRQGEPETKPSLRFVGERRGRPEITNPIGGRRDEAGASA